MVVTRIPQMEAGSLRFVKKGLYSVMRHKGRMNQITNIDFDVMVTNNVWQHPSKINGPAKERLSKPEGGLLNLECECVAIPAFHHMKHVPTEVDPLSIQLNMHARNINGNPDSERYNLSPTHRCVLTHREPTKPPDISGDPRLEEPPLDQSRIQGDMDKDLVSLVAKSSFLKVTSQVPLLEHVEQ